MARAKKQPQRDGLGENVTIDQLLLFRSVFGQLKTGQSLRTASRAVGTTESKLKTSLDNVAVGLGLSRGQLLDQARAADHENTSVGRFHARIGQILDDLLQVRSEITRTPQRVLIAGGELMLFWLLPRVLKQYELMNRFPRMTLDLRRVLPSDGIKALQLGKADLLLGASPEGMAGSIESHRILEVKCGLIFHRTHAEKSGKEPHQVRLHDLSEYPIFVVRPEAAPFFMLERFLPHRFRNGRLVYVDSNMYMYNYVVRGIGVGISYEPKVNPFGDAEQRFSPTNIDGDLFITPLHLEPPIPPAVFHIFWAADMPHRKMSREASAIKDAVIDFASKYEQDSLAV